MPPAAKARAPLNPALIPCRASFSGKGCGDGSSTRCPPRRWRAACSELEEGRRPPFSELECPLAPFWSGARTRPPRSSRPCLPPPGGFGAARHPRPLPLRSLFCLPWTRSEAASRPRRLPGWAKFQRPVQLPPIRSGAGILLPRLGSQNSVRLAENAQLNRPHEYPPNIKYRSAAPKPKPLIWRGFLRSCYTDRAA